MAPKKAAIQPNDMQSEIDVMETKRAPDGPREVVEPCIEEKKRNARSLTNQGFCPSRMFEEFWNDNGMTKTNPIIIIRPLIRRLETFHVYCVI